MDNDEIIKQQRIMKLVVRTNRCKKAIFDAFQTLRICMDPLPKASYLTKAMINFMGKYDPEWIGITHLDYKISIPVFKAVYNHVRTQLKNP